MTLKEREQTVKDLQEIVDNYSGSWKRFNVLDNALALIKELTEEIKDLEADYDRVYEQAEADIHANMADGGTSCHWCMDKTKADTIKMVQRVLKESFEVLEYDANINRKTVKVEELYDQVNWVLHEVVPNRIDDVVRELLEENK